MAKKKKHPEHENLERWLISYADFITLLFATFVVLYALSQVDINDFKALEQSIKQAFSAPSVMQGSDGLLASNDSVFDGQQADSVITPLMMEYTSQKYEDQSFDEIQKTIDSMNKSGDLSGVEAEKTDRGLLITFNNDYLFKSGSANLLPDAQKKLDKIGALIGKKFYMHYMRVEGHTDNQKISSSTYPSNWELSAARSSSIIRYLIGRFKFLPSLFTAVGFADTRPIADNKTSTGKAKNRRVELLILKNKYMAQESPQNEVLKMDKNAQETMQSQRMEIINKIELMSDSATNLSKGDKQAAQNAVILNQVYEKELHRINKETEAFDESVKTKITGQGKWLKPPAGAVSKQNTKVNIRKEIANEFKSVGQ